MGFPFSSVDEDAVAGPKSNIFYVAKQELDQSPLKVLEPGSEMIRVIFKKD